MMPHATTLSEAHKVLREVEDELKAEIPRVTVIVHLDPCDGRCERDTCTFFCRRKT
jgi:divalent metal cation (Fe/Co/Zn/Cd) transporter